MIPAGTKALSFYYQDASVTAPFDATLTVKVDATTVKTLTEKVLLTPTTPVLRVDIAAFADGAAHNVSLNYLNVAAGSASMFVDDVQHRLECSPRRPRGADGGGGH